MAWLVKAMSESFFLTNMSPQVPAPQNQLKINCQKTKEQMSIRVHLLLCVSV
ncbi:hypothetical protein CMK14_01925 [Candidatus Poribacteria bacterium]|nr:hypothetical protein [Candidatus Poribacteria bacterium]